MNVVHFFNICAYYLCCDKDRIEKHDIITKFHIL